MQKIEVSAAYREKLGKGPSRQMRMAGQVPAVLYRKGVSTTLSLNPKEIDRVLNSASGENSLITLKLSGGQNGEGVAVAEHLAVLKEIQRNPVTDNMVHVDLFEILMNELITLRIPVVLTGAAIGVKNGGIVQHSARELEVRCLPALIPDSISVDVSALKIGDSIHVREMVMAEGIELLTDRNQSIVSVVPPISEAKMEAILATAPKETKEPEVIGQKEKEAAAAEKGDTKAKGGEKAKPEGKK
jgi:large subunit ribosomal protein L25